MEEVDFIVVGAQKAGTTSLFGILRDHPEIFLPESKELHFFDKISTPEIEDIANYKQHFSGVENSKVKGEITPDYLFYSYAADNIKRILGPNVKIIIILRNPVERAYSQFNFHRAKGVEEKVNFLSAIENEVVKEQADDYETWALPPYYLSRSMYHTQIKGYYDLFGENVHTIIFEEFFGNQHETELRNLLQFLGVSGSFDAKADNLNQTKLNNSKHLYEGLRYGRMIKKIIGESRYLKLRKLVLAKIQSKPEGLTTSIINELISKYFIEDIKKTELLLGRELRIWYDN